MAQAIYPTDILSILDKHPNVPAQFVHVLHMNESIVSGTPINNDNLRKAEATAQSLRSLHRDHAEISEEMVETAVNRSTMVRATHAEIQFGQGNGAVLALLQGLTQAVAQLNTTVRQVKVNGDRVAAIAMNSRIVWRNRDRRPDEPYTWRQKEVAGSGADLVAALYGARNPLTEQNVQELGAATLGSVPGPQHTLNLHGASTHHDIARMILFYNENFGIVAADTIDVRRARLIYWLGGH